MFFPNSTPKVALGGIGNTQQKDRQQILEATRQARADRQRKKTEQQASTRIQAFWRAWRCRSHMCTIWQAEFDALSEATKAQQLRPLHRLFSLFHRVYRPHDPACLHVLARVCEAVAAVQDNKLLFASCSGEELDRACLHVSRICTATLRTLQHQGYGKEFQQLLSDPPQELYGSPTQQILSVCLRVLDTMTTASSWHANGRASSVAFTKVIRRIADEGLFLSIAVVCCGLRPDATSQSCAARLVTRLASAYAAMPFSLDSSQTGGKHRQWLILAVPGSTRANHVAMQPQRLLAASALASLSSFTPAQLHFHVLTAACELGYCSSTRQQEASGDVAVCALQLLASLCHAVCTAKVQLATHHVVAWSRTSRLLVALLPPRARAEVSAEIAEISGTAPTCVVCTSSCYNADQDMATEDDEDAFSGQSWYLPSLESTVPSAKLSRGTARVPVHLEVVHVPYPIAGSLIVSKLSAACRVAGERATALAVSEFSTWLFMMLALKAADKVMLITKWAAGGSLVQLLWLHGILPLRKNAAADISQLPEAEVQWQPQEGLPAWFNPLLVVSIVYSQFVSTAPDAVLFSEQAPIPLSQLLDDDGSAPTGFIPTLREALMSVLFAAHTGTSAAFKKLTVRKETARSFKLLAGKLLEQLHARAARVPTISDTVFHARYLQHAHFHRDVNAALGLVDLFPGEDEEMEDVSALRESHSAYVELLKYAPCLVRFEDRAAVFQELVRRDRESVRSSEPRRMMSQLVVTVHRSSVFEDSLELLKDLTSVDLKSPLKISFIDEHGTLEAGIDGGGLFKDFIECLLREAFDPEKGVFNRTDDGAIFPNPAAWLPKQPPGKPPYTSFDVFRLLGSMLGKAMYEGIIVELPLAAFFLKKLRGVSSDLNDLPSLDRQLYRNLLELSKPETDLDLLALNFTIQRNAASTDESDVPLMAGGADIIVDRTNLPLYLTFVADYRLNREIAPNATAFLDGFNKLIDQSWLRMFNDRELQQLISGDCRGGFDLEDFREHVQLGGGYHSNHPVIAMLWSALATLSVRQQEAFLKFVTACSRPPLLGFKHLHPPIAINMRGHVGNTSDESALPTASTCFNLLKLPPYKDKTTLIQKLLIAIESTQGFDLS